MFVIALLLAHALALGGVADRMLSRALWPARHPRAALLGWHACALGFFAALFGALVLTAHGLWEHAVVWLFHADKPLVHAAYAGSWQLEGVAEAALLLLLAGTTAFSALAVRRYARSVREQAKHRLAVDAADCPSGRGRPEIRVLEQKAPTAFCIPGSRGRSRIVLTTGALELLTAEQVAATIEHERAHLHLRHHRAILLSDVVTAAVGWSGLLPNYAGQVRRLAEMAADDRAAERHGGRTVATALLEMCSAPETELERGAGAPGMTGPDPAERIRRLLAGRSAGARRSRLPAFAAACAVVIALALPAAVAVTPAAVLVDTAHCATRCCD